MRFAATRCWRKQAGALVSALCLVGAISCGKARDGATVKEAPNEKNNPEKLGLEPPFPWKSVQGPTSYQLDRSPWTDTYWPTYKRGLAQRYQTEKPNGVERFSFHRFLENFFTAVDAGDPAATAKLSPGEKHDLALSEGWDAFGDLTRKDLLKKAKSIDAQLAKDLGAISGDASSDPVKKKKIAALKKAAGKVSDLIRGHEALRQKAPVVMEAWSSWALKAGYSQNQVHPVNEFDVGGTDVVDPETRNWAWEGICHGWAPAALYAEEPKHAVMAEKPDGRRILFTEGDIRGMLSKAWADQSPYSKQTFIGGRCDLEDDEIRTDSYGRSLDATIRCTSCDELDDLGLHFERKFAVGGIPVYRYTAWGRNQPSHYVVRTKWITGPYGNQEGFHGRQFHSFADVKTWVQNEQAELGQPVKVYFQGQCRDVNPMTFHLLLTQFMTQGHGFVMDRTRAAQVWNQPVKGYELEYKQVRGSPVGPNELTPVTEIVDPYWRHRAPGTRFLVNLEVTLEWTTEKGPYSTYTYRAEDGGTVDIDELTAENARWPTIRTLELSYTLEFDKDKNLIGGEWGLVPSRGDARERDRRNDQAPDFIYLFEEGAEPVRTSQSALNYGQVVEKIHQCSLREDGELKTSEVTGTWGEPITYKDCALF